MFNNFIHVIDVQTVTDGRYAHVFADPQSQKGVCFIK